MAVDELREATEHIERARRLLGIQPGRYTDRKLADARNNIDVVLDREFGISRREEGDA